MSSVSHAQAAHLSARRRRTRAPSGVSERRERPPSLRAYPPPHSSSLQRVCLQHATEHEVGPARRQFRLGTGELSLETPPTVQGEPANCARRARQLFKESPPTVQGGPANCARSARQLFKESPPTVQREPANCSSRAHQLCKEGPPTVQGEPANCSRRARQLFKESPPTVQGAPANCSRRARQLFKEGPPTVQGGPANWRARDQGCLGCLGQACLGCQGTKAVSREMARTEPPLIASSHPATDQPGSPEPQVGRALLARLDFKRARPSRGPLRLGRFYGPQRCPPWRNFKPEHKHEQKTDTINDKRSNSWCEPGQEKDAFHRISGS